MGSISAQPLDWAGELEVRRAALWAGVGLGFCSVVAVLLALALGLPATHRGLVAALMVAAGIANGGMLALPGRWWSVPRRGDWLLAGWSTGLLALVGTVALLAGARAQLGLLLFLVVPFLATVHAGPGRTAWLAVAIAGVSALSALQGAGAGRIVLLAVLLGGAAMLAVALADLNRRAAAARVALHERAELERLLLAEAHHRIKNSLQTVADLLLLGRPEGEAGRPFDETSGRIRAIAVVHRLLAEQRGVDVPAAALLQQLVQGLAPEVEVRAGTQRIDATVAQHLGVVAHELIVNALTHGRPPVTVSLSQEAADPASALRLVVRDHGEGPQGTEPGLGLTLVGRIVDQGLHGSFTLARTADGATEALVRFPE